jgi:hypothetical protein
MADGPAVNRPEALGRLGFFHLPLKHSYAFPGSFEAHPTWEQAWKERKGWEEGFWVHLPWTD